MQPKNGPIVVIAGTRPEGIKMAPVYFALQEAGLPTLFCSTTQHSELLTQVLALFTIEPDIHLNVMRPNQDLFYVTQSVLQKTKDLFSKIEPSLVLVQGDTTSTMVAALSAFYLKIPVGHVEAGLRTDDIYAPFPEEMNRRVVSQLATHHFAPTQLALDALTKDGITQNVFLTGNTVVDALHMMQKNITSGTTFVRADIQKRIAQSREQGKKIILLTAHRRESFNGGIQTILQTVKTFLQENPDVFCIYPFHPNPNVITAIADAGLAAQTNCYVSEPVAYNDLVYILSNSDCVVTDSGGIQEEAISLGKPVLVLREKTERMEGVHAGIAHLVGCNAEKITQQLQTCLQSTTSVKNTHVYGDGTAAQQIVQILQKQRYSRHTKTVLQKHAVHKKRNIVDKKVCVVGLGYIGLPTAIVMADHQIKVIGVDVDATKVAKINAGDPVIAEPDVYEKLQLALQAQLFCASTQTVPADYYMIAVPTPFHPDKTANLQYVFDAADSITPVLKKGNTIILESTVPVGTTHRLAEYIAKKTEMVEGKDFFVAHCPERVLPGKIMHELVENTRIIGGVSNQAVTKAKELYKEFVNGSLYLTDAKTAEMVKLVENSSRDAQLAFAHQVASMADTAGLNPYEVIELANKHPRVDILKPSAGVGGHCIAVDPWFLIETFPEQTKLLQIARAINDNRPNAIIAKIETAITKWQQINEHQKCNVILLGVTYKPDVDDLRESPALYIAKQLQHKETISVQVCEPHVSKQLLSKQLGDCITTVSEGLPQADIVVYLVAHKRFNAIDASLLHNKQIIDATGIVHKPAKHAADDEHLFWPAHSSLDFFITHQESSEVKEHTP